MENRLFSDKIDVCQEMSSPTFSTGSHTWTVHLRKNTDDSKHVDYVCLFLRLEPGPGPSVCAAYEFKLKLPATAAAAASRKVTSYETFTHTKRNSSQFTRFMPMNKLNHKGGDDLPQKLEIICEVYLVEQQRRAMSPMIDVSASLDDSWSFDDSKLKDDFASLQYDVRFSDFTVQVGGTSHQVHRNVLSARCSVFRRMFESNVQENAVNVDDIRPDVFRQLLDYLYTGRVPRLHEVAVPLLQAADKYDLKELKDICADAAIEQINLDNAAEMIDLAYKYDAIELKKNVVIFVRQNSDELAKTNGWKSLMKQRKDIMLDIFKFT